MVQISSYPKLNATIFELPCFDRRKSFYGKAQVVQTNEGQYLRSYDTYVCFLGNNHNFVKLWDGYSATTMRHINSFMQYCSLPYGGKSWWDKLEVVKKYAL